MRCRIGQAPSPSSCFSKSILHFLIRLFAAVAPHLPKPLFPCLLPSLAFPRRFLRSVQLIGRQCELTPNMLFSCPRFFTPTFFSPAYSRRKLCRPHPHAPPHNPAFGSAFSLLVGCSLRVANFQRFLSSAVEFPPRPNHASTAAVLPLLPYVFCIFPPCPLPCQSSLVPIRGFLSVPPLAAQPSLTPPH